MWLDVDGLNSLLEGKHVVKIGDMFCNPPVKDVYFEWVASDDDEEDLVLASDTLSLEWYLSTEDGMSHVATPSTEYGQTNGSAFLIGGVVVELLNR